MRFLEFRFFFLKSLHLDLQICQYLDLSSCNLSRSLPRNRLVECMFHEASAGASYMLRLSSTNQTWVQPQQYDVRGLLKEQASGRDWPRYFPTGEPSSRKGFEAASQFSHDRNAWRVDGLG